MLKKLLLLIAICNCAACAAETDAPESNGIKYQHIVKDSPLSVHVLEVDPSRFRLGVTRALNDGLGRESVLSMSNRTGAAGGINGGYYRMGGTFDGLSQGALKIDGQWFSWPEKDRGAIGWTQDGKMVLIGRLRADWKLTFGGKEYRINGLNTPRTPDTSILYTWPFHRSTLSMPGGTEVLIHRGQVTELHKGLGDSKIPQDGYVYSVGKNISIDTSSLKSGTVAKLVRQVVPLDSQDAVETSKWQRVDYIVGGAPILVSGGKVNTDFKAENVQDSFLTMRYPRTAIGIKEDGTIVCVVVDGRQMSVSRGMTIPELAEFMFSLGCTDALNLDGGSSSTLVWGGQVINTPVVDTEESIDDQSLRRVSDAILFYTQLN